MTEERDPVLDAGYDARATTPNVLDILAEYRTRTDAAKAALPWSTHRYGATEAERLDVYPARGGGGAAPVLLFIHGGYWRALDSADSGSMAPGFTAAGAVVMSVNYALAPGATLDGIVGQCRRALGWVAANAAALGGDPRRIHVAGSSAGGHLAAMLAVPGIGPPVAGLTLLSGLFDLTPLPRTRINDWMRLDAAAARRNSPAFLPPPSGLDVVLAHGDTETGAFKRQTSDFAAALAPGNRVRVVPPRPGSNHFDLLFDLGEPGNPLFEATRAAMGLSG